MQTAPRRRMGCLGQLILLAVFAVVLAMGVVGVTNPWIFTVGGHFRIWPEWTGSGQMQGPGGTYRMFVSFHPARGGSRILPSTSVRGSGWICTPSGRTYQVRLGGGAPLAVWRDMNNQPFTLYTYSRGTFSTQHEPPEVRLKGRWNGPNLILNDEGTLTRAFAPDGTLISHPGKPGAGKEITFAETGWWFGDPCPHG
jgi:hypothetical protein